MGSVQTPHGAHVTQAGKGRSPQCSGKSQPKEKQGRESHIPRLQNPNQRSPYLE